MHRFMSNFKGPDHDSSSSSFKFVKFKKTQSVIFPFDPLPDARTSGNKGNVKSKKLNAVVKSKVDFEETLPSTKITTSTSEFNLSAAVNQKEFPALQKSSCGNKQKSSLNKYYSESDIRMTDKHSPGEAWFKFLDQVAQLKDIIPEHLKENVGEPHVQQNIKNSKATTVALKRHTSQDDLNSCLDDIALGRELLAELSLDSHDTTEEDKWKVADATPDWWKYHQSPQQLEKTNLPIYTSCISNTPAGTQHKSLIYENECATYASYIATLQTVPPNVNYKPLTSYPTTASTYKYFEEASAIPKISPMINPKPSISNPKPSISNPKPSTSNPKPSTSNPKPSTSNPKPPTYASHLLNKQSGQQGLRKLQSITKEKNKGEKNKPVEQEKQVKDENNPAIFIEKGLHNPLYYKNTKPPSIHNNKIAENISSNFVILNQGNTNEVAVTFGNTITDKKRTSNVKEMPSPAVSEKKQTRQAVKWGGRAKLCDKATQTYWQPANCLAPHAQAMTSGLGPQSYMNVPQHNNIQNFNCCYMLNYENASARNNFMFDPMYNFYPRVNNTENRTVQQNDLEGRELQTVGFRQLQEEMLFYLFHCVTGDTIQMKAAAELFYRGWRYHVESKMWVTRIHEQYLFEVTDTHEEGIFYVFDPHCWRKYTQCCNLLYSKLQLEHPYTNPTSSLAIYMH